MLSIEQKNYFINDIIEIRKKLKALKTENTLEELERFENELTLNELEDCFFNTNFENCETKLIELIVQRWERIRGSSMCYTQKPSNLVNQLCLNLATALSPPITTPSEIEALEPNTGPYHLLMPSLESSEDVYGQNIHSLELHEFVLSDKERAFIPLLPCLHQASISDEGQLRHMVEIDGGYPELTPSEMVRVSKHSKPATELYQSILALNKQRLLGDEIGARLNQLAVALRRGGARGSGAELNAGAEANIGILAFSNYWNGLSQQQRTTLFAETPGLREIIGRLFRPEDVNYRETRFCVELLANALDSIIEVYNKKPSIQILQERVVAQENTLKSVLKNLRNLVTVQNPPKNILHHIFKLSAAEQKKIFKFDNYENALVYALAREPEELSKFKPDEKSKQQAIKIKPHNNFGLIIAAKTNTLNAIELLLSWGSDIEFKDENGLTAMHWAANNGRIDIVNCLLEHGAQVESLTRRKNTPLNVAVLQGKRAVVDILLQRSNLNARNLDGKNALDIAIKYHPELVEPILMQIATLPISEQKECLLRVPGGPYPNAFFYAAANKPELLYSLTSQTLNHPEYSLRDALIENRDSAGWTTLHWAAVNGDVDTVNCLLENDSQLEALTHGKNTPLNLAVWKGKRAVVDILLQRSNLNARSIDGKNVLDIAIKNHPELVEPILMQIATLPISEQRECLAEGSYPNVFFYAAAKESGLFYPLISQTLSQPEHPLRDAIIENRDKAGWTTLHWAAGNGDVDTVNCLLENGSQLEALTLRKNTPLNVAVLQGKGAVVDLLLQQSNLNARNLDGQNALDIAIKKHPELVEPILMQIATLPISEQRECLLKVAGGPFYNVFFYAGAKNKSELFHTLISQTLSDPEHPLRDVLIKNRDKTGSTTLHWAARNGDVDAVTCLLDNGSQLEALTHKENTPLNLAVLQGKKAVVDLLLQRSNLNARNIDGKNALDIAIKYRPELVEPILMQIATLPHSEQKECLLKVAGGPYPNAFFYAATVNTKLLQSLLRSFNNNALDSKMQPIHEQIHQIALYYQKMKRNPSKNLDYKTAVSTAETLLNTTVDEMLKVYQSDDNTDVKILEFKNSCQKAIETARPGLTQYREWGKVLATFLLVVITLPVSLPLYAAGFFSLEHKPERLLDELEIDVNKLR